MLRKHFEGLWHRGRVPGVGLRSTLCRRRGVPCRRGVSSVHRGRFGGNARKRKSKLNDDTFNAMISGPAAIVDRELDVLGEVDTATIVPFIVTPSGIAPITPADLRLRGSLRDRLDIDLA